MSKKTKIPNMPLLEPSVVFIISLVCFAGLCGHIWLRENFGPLKLASIIFALHAPTTGTPSIYIESGITYGLCAVNLALLCSFIFCFLRRLALNRVAICLFYILLGGFFVASAMFLDREYKVADYVSGRWRESGFIAEHYAVVTGKDIAFPAGKRNVILLVMESMENTFYQPPFAPPLLPNLQKLQAENLSFPEHVEIYGTNWTMAGVVAYLFGLPLLVPTGGNSYDDRFVGFLPGASCVLTVLENSGYGIHWLQGSDLAFAGVDHLLKSRVRRPHVLDLAYFKERAAQGKVYSVPFKDWGLSDKDLYAEAKEYLFALERQGEPFFLVMFTLDTHARTPLKGYEEHRYGDERDLFLTADAMAADFVNWVKKQDFYANTALVIAGDHYFMSETLGGRSLNNRTIYNVFLNTGKNGSKTRSITSFDMAPSLLEAAGAALPEGRFGLGASVLSDGRPTLLEQYGREKLDHMLSLPSKRYENFFLPPETD